MIFLRDVSYLWEDCRRLAQKWEFRVGCKSGALNQTTKDWHTRVVTLSATKGLAERFFAPLRMTPPCGHRIKCAHVLWFDLGITLCAFLSVGLEQESRGLPEIGFAQEANRRSVRDHGNASTT